MQLFRVLPWLPAAPSGEPGHPLYVHPHQGAGRLDNPAHYRVLYVSDAAEGAVAESFGPHAVWTDALLAGRPALRGSRTALATFELRTPRVLDLDDAHALVERALRPSQVVLRDRAVTQAWALAAFTERTWRGIRWWSYYDPRWGSHGLWDLRGLRLVNVEPLRWDHPAVIAAQHVLLRPIRTQS